MKNLHIEHPEDTSLTGDLSVLDAFQSDNHYSVKIDGSPAIVWGTDPENGMFIELMREFDMKKTPDGAKWEEADFTEMQELMDEL